MKYSERFFKFPVKLYLSKDINEKSDLEARLGIQLGPEVDPEPEYVLGWEAMDIEDICGYGTIFSRNKTIEDVKREGFDCTIVYLRYGKEIGCSWSPKKFEEKLTQFCEKLEEIKIAEEKRELKEAMEEIPKRKGLLSRIFGR